MVCQNQLLCVISVQDVYRFLDLTPFSMVQHQLTLIHPIVAAPYPSYWGGFWSQLEMFQIRNPAKPFLLTEQNAEFHR